MRVEREKKRSQLWKYLLPVGVTAVVLAAFVIGSTRFAESTGERGQETLERAIARASVRCYAIEGRYPPDVQYLEDNYGVQIDRSKYNVFYEGFASNLMPDITVYPVQEAEE